SQSDRAIPVDDLADIVAAGTDEDAVSRFDDVADALDAARTWAADAPRRGVIVTGSITLVGEALSLAVAREWLKK
ncbi:hypothetical protein QN416_25795, partial [Glaciimonas sp. Cout2]